MFVDPFLFRCFHRKNIFSFLEVLMPIPSGEAMTCRDCGLSLPLAKFSRNGRKDGYRRPECRSCQHSRSKEINPNYQYTPGAIAARDAHQLPSAQIQRLKKAKLKQQDNECIYCIAKLSENSCELDHKTPLSVGGLDEPRNFQVLCQRCNREKHSKTHNEYVAWLIGLGV